MWLRKVLKSLNRFNSANKVKSYNSRWKRKKNPEATTEQSTYKNNKCLSWVSAVSIRSLVGSRSPPCLPRMHSSAGLVSGSAVGAAQTLIWSCSCVFSSPVSTAVRTSAYSLVRILRHPFVYSTDSLCSRLREFSPQFVQLVGRFWVILLSHTALGVSWVLPPPLHVGCLRGLSGLGPFL